MVQQHHAHGVFCSPGAELFGAKLCEIESGYEVGNHHAALAVDLADASFPIPGVRHREHRVGVRVVDELLRHQPVKDGLDRGCGGSGFQHVGDELIDHLWIRERRQFREFQHVREEHRRKALRLDRFQIPAAAFDVEDRLLLAEQVFLPDLDRSVAATVQHQGLVAAEQPRSVDAQAEIAAELSCFPVVPQASHGNNYTGR